MKTGHFTVSPEQICSIPAEAADNMVFGSGGALLQKLNRDTFKCCWAQTACVFLVTPTRYEDHQQMGIS